MAKGAYIGVNSVARKIKNCYIGVNGVARKIKKAYIGVNGVARLFWSSLVSPLYLFSQEQSFTSIQNCNVAKQQLNGGITYYNAISMSPTSSMATYLYLNGVQWSKYSKLQIKYVNTNSIINIGHSSNTESYSNNIDYIFQNTDGVETLTYDISMTDDEYLVIYCYNSSSASDYTFLIYELALIE